jgi:hypothetical protein
VARRDAGQAAESVASLTGRATGGDEQALELLTDRAVRGDEEALASVRALARSDRAAVARLGDLAAQVEGHWIDALYQDEPSRFLTRVAASDQRRELLGPAPSAIERLLVDRIIATHLEVSAAARHVALRYRESTPIALAEYHQAWLDRAQRRHLHALKALAQVRRLLLPAVQINVAEQQVNQVVSNGVGPRP